jgi:16S rRNA G1207 methylase RsmC
MSERSKKVDFDEYSDQYEDLVSTQLGFFSKDRGYFSDYKADLVARYLENPPKNILDFGSGIGLNLAALSRVFPDARIHATDISEQSLAHIRDKYPDVTVIANKDLDGFSSFDLIFVAGVFHHIAPELRPEVMARLALRLSDTGSLFIFEHNPYNPVTRRMVATCPFDEDAVLLSMREMKRRMHEGGMKVTGHGYCLFFPEWLKGLQPLERLMPWLPLGGQYYVVSSR